MRSWIVWATGLFAYIVAVLDRTTLGVSGLAAADRFEASASLLSTFVVLQVIVYACAQVPAGLLLDRFGSKAMILTGAALMASGQLALALHRVTADGRRGACGSGRSTSPFAAEPSLTMALFIEGLLAITTSDQRARPTRY